MASGMDDRKLCLDTLLSKASKPLKLYPKKGPLLNHSHESQEQHIKRHTISGRSLSTSRTSCTNLCRVQGRRTIFCHARVGLDYLPRYIPRGYRIHRRPYQMQHLPAMPVQCNSERSQCNATLQRRSSPSTPKFSVIVRIILVLGQQRPVPPRRQIVLQVAVRLGIQIP